MLHLACFERNISLCSLLMAVVLHSRKDKLSIFEIVLLESGSIIVKHDCVHQIWSIADGEDFVVYFACFPVVCIVQKIGRNDRESIMFLACKSAGKFFIDLLLERSMSFWMKNFLTVQPSIVVLPLVHRDF